ARLPVQPGLPVQSPAAGRLPAHLVARARSAGQHALRQSGLIGQRSVQRRPAWAATLCYAVRVVIQAHRQASRAHRLITKASGRALPSFQAATRPAASAATLNCSEPSSAEALPACAPCPAMAQAVALGITQPRLAMAANSS